MQEIKSSLKVGQVAINLKNQLGFCIQSLHNAQEYTNQRRKKSFINTIFQSSNQENQDIMLEEKIRQDTKIALIQGMRVIHQLQTAIQGEEIQYKIVIAGEQMYEANVNLEDVLESSQFDFSKKGGFTLRLTATKSQMQQAINAIDNVSLQNKINNSVLSKMQKVQLPKGIDMTEAKKVWDNLVNIKTNLESFSRRKMINYLKNTLGDEEFNKLYRRGNKIKNLPGWKINYGNITEAFYEALTYGDISNLTSADYFQLIEKSRNNLAHYKGGDVENFQIKALSNFEDSKVGRVDIATVSNVLTPLTQIYEAIDSEGIINISALKKVFEKKVGEGDRPFNERIKVKIEEIVRKAIK